MAIKSKLAKGFDLPVPAQRTAISESAARKFEKAATVDNVRIVVYVPPDIAEALRLKCFQAHRSVSDAAREAFRAWLGT